MFARTSAILNRGFVHRYFDNKNVACFSALSAKHKGGGATPGELSKKSDPAAEGSEGGYGGSGISNVASDYKLASEGPGSLGHGGPGNLNRGNYKGGERRRREEKDMEDAAASVAEMAKMGVVGAMETGLKIGEMAKRTMDGVWDATRKTTESVRDSVADDDDDDDSGDYRRKPGSDKHVEDLRRRAGGYGLKD
ncbi:hypothetical protein ABFS82_13G072300 [Erythranthe guttata]|uniref:Uncharacterized protein n=1 Tax=Erythranthe guttata TaxID=4155 RepID=A0A022RWS9_ERYGU|nr:PREDICTED: uncharacterized protein LOC105968696 [Erythranthe guttata]EYU44962.1 hypothetical protein MIMGU_mgv1a014337mg [Erythranthe guttata]|eukprot:XP_012848799.1 PREDICTED: uncharacterized protein LOC105968696 [Erythranthe guttata]